MEYIEVRFKLKPVDPWADLLADELAGIGFESFVTEEDGLSAYCSEEEYDEDAMLALDLLTTDNPFAFSYTSKRYESQNWNEEWEKNFSPINVDNQVYVRASFHEADASIPIELLIDPKMSFGTGHHQTTFLMISKMLKLNFEGLQVLDMGTGTGVLAILASKLGAKHIVAVDNNEWAYKNTNENLEKNGVSNCTNLHGEEDVVGDGPFDIILANITKNVIKAQLPMYAQWLVSGGELLVSGVLKYDAPEVIELAKEQGLNLYDENYKDDWSMLAFRK